MSVKINSLEFENVKRIKAVQLTPAANGLTVIGGKNRQGKTSVLDSIAWALGGDRFRPSEPHREGSVTDPHLKLTLDNGIVVERSGKNGSLKVIDPEGRKGGQQLLNSFVESFAIDLPRFLDQTGKEKAQTLLRIIGVGDQLAEYDRQEQELYNRRHALGQIGEQKAKYAAELTTYPGVPEQPVPASELIRRQQEILARNGENARKRAERDRYNAELEQAQTAFLLAQKRLREAEHNAEIANREASGLVDESTAELEQSIAEIEETNEKVRANLEKERAETEAEGYREQYRELTDEIEAVRGARIELLNGADLPLPGLTVEGGELIYNGQRWDGMSGAEQLVVATSIVRRLNPECGFVLLDKLEQMDADTLAQFGSWLEGEGLQAIATRVSTGDECSIIIEDGMSLDPREQTTNKTWKAGAF
ncbi:MAG: AAA family ATPase [Ruminococcus sp.]|nr:AAA family ATPase [Ruminococcus sp.]